MRKLTEAQKQKSAEARARFKSVCDKVAGLTDAERAALSARMNVITVEEHQVSPHNQMLLAYQRESVTIVGGFRQWLKQGRCVAKGESGLKIWCPTARPQRKSEDNDKPGFIIATVFDISQTVPLDDSNRPSTLLEDGERVISQMESAEGDDNG